MSVTRIPAAQVAVGDVIAFPNGKSLTVASIVAEGNGITYVGTITTPSFYEDQIASAPGEYWEFRDGTVAVIK